MGHTRQKSFLPLKCEGIEGTPRAMAYCSMRRAGKGRAEANCGCVVARDRGEASVERRAPLSPVLQGEVMTRIPEKILRTWEDMISDLPAFQRELSALMKEHPRGVLDIEQRDEGFYEITQYPILVFKIPEHWV
jgi:hypothetical protein